MKALKAAAVLFGILFLAGCATLSEQPGFNFINGAALIFLIIMALVMLIARLGRNEN